jgi:hypothetical protein
VWAQVVAIVEILKSLEGIRSDAVAYTQRYRTACRAFEKPRGASQHQQCCTRESTALLRDRKEHANGEQTGRH